MQPLLLRYFALSLLVACGSNRSTAAEPTVSVEQATGAQTTELPELADCRTHDESDEAESSLVLVVRAEEYTLADTFGTYRFTMTTREQLLEKIGEVRAAMPEVTELFISDQLESADDSESQRLVEAFESARAAGYIRLHRCRTVDGSETGEPSGGLVGEPLNGRFGFGFGTEEATTEQ